MKLVIIESPFRGANMQEQALNIIYARKCARYSLIERGEAAWGSHMIWPQFLEDEADSERSLGIRAGLEWSRVADYHVFYTDRGWSEGMLQALNYCIDNQRPFRLRSLNGQFKLPSEELFDPHTFNLVKHIARLYP